MAIRKKVKKNVYLLILDCIGLVGAFNLAYYLYKYEIVSNYALTWVTFLILGLSFSIEYILNLNNFDENRSSNYVINRTLIHGFLLVILTNSVLFFTPLRYQGGLTGRGILFSALGFYITWSGLIRWLIIRVLDFRRAAGSWLIVADTETLVPFIKELDKTRFQARYSVLLDKLGVSKKSRDIPPEMITGDWKNIKIWKKLKPKGIILAVSDTDKVDLKLQSELMNARLSGIRIYDLTDFYEQQWQKVPVLNINQRWLVFSHGFDLIHNPIGIRVKNLIDVFVSLVLLVITSPLIVLTAVFVVLESGFPIIYKQGRTGLNGKVFTLYKFRSMKKDAEKNGAKWASENDDRTTRVGRIIRKLRFDELPQLINILKGEMSFIGPRPERPEFDRTLEKKIPYYNLRNSLKPGITGWAQVMYPYGASVEDAKEKLEYDIYYIKNYSLLLDLTILIRTIKVILHLQGR